MRAHLEGMGEFDEDETNGLEGKLKEDVGYLLNFFVFILGVQGVHSFFSPRQLQVLLKQTLRPHCMNNLSVAPHVQWVGGQFYPLHSRYNICVYDFYFYSIQC